MANSAANLPDKHRLTCVLASLSPFGLREQSSRALPTWIFLCDRLHSWRHNSQSCAWGKSEKRREPRHPSSIVGMISFWVITLVPQHSETHPQVINPRLSTISLSGSHETCRIHVVVLESWREFEWCHLLDPATNPKLASYPTTLFLSTYIVFSKKTRERKLFLTRWNWIITISTKIRFLSDLPSSGQTRKCMFDTSWFPP